VYFSLICTKESNRIVTVKTDKSIGEIDKTTMAKAWIRMPFLQVKYLNNFPNNKNMQKNFKIIEHLFLFLFLI